MLKTTTEKHDSAFSNSPTNAYFPSHILLYTIPPTHFPDVPNKQPPGTQKGQCCISKSCFAMVSTNVIMRNTYSVTKVRRRDLLCVDTGCNL